jgi:hypothetical protein
MLQQNRFAGRNVVEIHHFPADLPRGMTIGGCQHQTDIDDHRSNHIHGWDHLDRGPYKVLEELDRHSSGGDVVNSRGRQKIEMAGKVLVCA